MMKKISIALLLTGSLAVSQDLKASQVEGLSLLGRSCMRTAVHPMRLTLARSYGTIKGNNPNDERISVAQALRDRERELGLDKLGVKAYDDRFNELIKQGAIKTRYQILDEDASLEDGIAWMEDFLNVSSALNSLAEKLQNKSLSCPSPHCPFLYSLEERTQLLQQATKVSLPILTQTWLRDAATSAVNHSQWLHSLAQGGRQVIDEQLRKPHYGNQLNDIYKITGLWKSSRTQQLDLSYQDSISIIEKLIDEGLLLAEECFNKSHTKKD